MTTKLRADLTPAVVKALKWVRNRLKDGTIKYDLNGPEPANRFDMSRIVDRTLRATPGGTVRTCGTVGCIGGWMAIHQIKAEPNAKGVYKLKAEQATKIYHVFEAMCRHTGLHDLFYPDACRVAITPAQGVAAIDNVLATGRPHWNKIVRTVSGR